MHVGRAKEPVSSLATTELHAAKVGGQSGYDDGLEPQRELGAPDASSLDVGHDVDDRAVIPHGNGLAAVDGECAQGSIDTGWHRRARLTCARAIDDRTVRAHGEHPLGRLAAEIPSTQEGPISTGNGQKLLARP